MECPASSEVNPRVTTAMLLRIPVQPQRPALEEQQQHMHHRSHDTQKPRELYEHPCLKIHVPGTEIVVKEQQGGLAGVNGRLVEERLREGDFELEDELRGFDGAGKVVHASVVQEGVAGCY